MMRLLWVELKVVVPLFIFIFGVLSAVSIWLDSDALFTFAAMLGFLHPLFARRSRWYLNLPFSRKKVIGIVLLQLLSLVVIQLFLFMPFYVWTFFHGRTSAYELTLGFFCGVTALMSAMGMALMTMGSMSLKRPAARTKLNLRAALIQLGALLGLGALVFWRLLEEPIFIRFLNLSFAFIFILIPLHHFAYPSQGVRLIIQRLFIGLCAVFVGAIAIDVFHAYFSDPGSSAARTALRNLGSAPIPISDARAIAIFEESASEDTPILHRRIAALRAVPFENWRKRTLGCKSDVLCLSLSEAATDLRLISPSELAQRAEMVLSPDGKFQGRPIEHCRLDKTAVPHCVWLQKLAEQGALEKWLRGDELNQNVIAMMYLQDSLTPSQLDRVKALSEDSNAVVKEAANRVLAGNIRFKLDHPDCLELSPTNEACTTTHRTPASKE